MTAKTTDERVKDIEELLEQFLAWDNRRTLITLRSKVTKLLNDNPMIEMRLEDVFQKQQFSLVYLENC